jgi:hypothetical protein
MRSLFTTATTLAASQHGRVKREQLLAEGIDASRIRRWLADGRLHQVHRGVYAIGRPPPSMHGEYMAAVLACGRGAALSHRADAHLLKIIVCSKPPPPEVTVPTANRRARPGIAVHRVRSLPVEDTSEFEGIPVTTVPRLLLDLAPSLSDESLTRACDTAWHEHRTSPDMILACIERNHGKPGASRLRRALGSDVTLSMLEDAFIALLRRHNLPLPRTNIDHAGHRVDCHWPAEGLTVELVSYRWHASRRAFEADVTRRRGSNHLAFSYGDICERGRATVAELTFLAGWRTSGDL